MTHSIFQLFPSYVFRFCVTQQLLLAAVLACENGKLFFLRAEWMRKKRERRKKSHKHTQGSGPEKWKNDDYLCSLFLVFSCFFSMLKVFQFSSNSQWCPTSLYFTSTHSPLDQEITKIIMRVSEVKNLFHRCVIFLGKSR